MHFRFLKDNCFTNRSFTGEEQITFIGNIVGMFCPSVDKQLMILYVTCTSNIGYALGNNIVTGEDTETTEVVEKETEATEQQETEIVEESGSVGEDEFDLGAEEEETVVFEFEEDEAADQELPASTYIYVIYK